MKRRMLVAMIVVCSLFGLTACGGIKSGEVTSKEFVKEHYTQEMQQIYSGQTCSGSGTSQVCTPLYTYMPYQQHHDDAWYLSIKNSKGKKGRVSVSETTFSEAQIGSYYNEDGTLSRSKPAAPASSGG